MLVRVHGWRNVINRTPRACVLSADSGAGVIRSEDTGTSLSPILMGLGMVVDRRLPPSSRHHESGVWQG
jgi:hypothetical protein